jgi:hypothetical protein
MNNPKIEWTFFRSIFKSPTGIVTRSIREFDADLTSSGGEAD